MLKVAIIEDEKLAMEQLEKMLYEISPEVEIGKKLYSVKESVRYLKGDPKIDIIFSDVQLQDGLAFEIFSQIPLKVPVIFITGYNEYNMKAFENNGIDFLLKPVEKSDLSKAILKYNRLQLHFSNKIVDESIGNLGKFINSTVKKRLIIKKGGDFIPLILDDIVLIYSQKKVGFIIDRFGKRFISDKNLTELEEEVSNEKFFRVNRQYIVNINYIKSYKSYEKVKLLVEMIIPDFNRSIIVSQVTAPSFRKWIRNTC